MHEKYSKEQNKHVVFYKQKQLKTRIYRRWYFCFIVHLFSWI